MGRQEFGDVELGHKARKNRLIRISGSMASDPSQAMSNCCGQNGAQSVSDFFLNGNVKDDLIMQAHFRKTVARIAGMKRVIVAQDTTDLDFSSHKALDGAGYISENPDTKGFLLHTAMAVDSDKIPYGFLSFKIWSRDIKDFGRKKTRKSRRFEDKESYKWYETIKNVESVLPEDQAALIVGDRESDIYELFARPRRKNIDILPERPITIAMLSSTARR